MSEKLLEKQSFEKMLDYKFESSLWEEFSIAEDYGAEGVKEHYKVVFDQWKDNLKFLTELVLVLNIKIFLWYGVDDTIGLTYDQLWKETDGYSVGKSQVSTSTMHKIHAKEFTLNDFSHEHLHDMFSHQLRDTIIVLNNARSKYIETKDKDYWWQMIQLLPSSYNQKRTICMSYEVVFKIIKERTGHKLDEWRTFVEVLKTLPYVKEIMGETE